MKNRRKERILIIVAVVFVLAAFLFMFKGNIFKGLTVGKSDITIMPTADGATSEISKKTNISQVFKCTVDNIDDVALVFTRLYYLDDLKEEDLPYITIELKDGDQVLMSKRVRVDCVEDQHRTFIESNNSLTGLKDRDLTIAVTNDSNIDTGLALMTKDDKKHSFNYNGMKVSGTLCFVVNSK